MDRALDELAKVAEALGDPLRTRILDVLAGGRANACCSPTNPEAPAAVCACDISADLGGLAPSKLAYHLARLRAAGLVHEQRKGKWVYYSVNREALSRLCHDLLRRWTGAASCCCARLSKPTSSDGERASARTKGGPVAKGKQTPR